MEFQAIQPSLDKLIHWIRTGRLALPDFQREFVWDPDQVVELLDSVARQWPIGSLLFLKGPQPFGFRAIEHAPSLGGRELETYVLDGQQRLTSLYHAVTNVSEYCYYVDFDAISNGHDEYLAWEKRSTFEKRFPTPISRASQHIALIAEIWEAHLFHEWLGYVSDPAIQRSYVALRDKQLGGLQAKVYDVVAVELDQGIQLEALARIFETLNRTGLKLNAFDLMVAILYPTGFDLRKEWEEAKVRSEYLERFQVDPIELLKLVSLLIRSNEGKKSARGVRQGDLLKLRRSSIQSSWQDAVALYEQSLEFLSTKLGVVVPELVPSWSMVLSVAALIRSNAPDRATAGWFWGSALLQTYGQAANTVVVRDFDAIAEGGAVDLLLERLTQPFPVLGDSARKNGLAMRALAAYLISQGAVDPYLGTPLKDVRAVVFRAVDRRGKLGALSAADSFDRLVVLSKESDRRLNKLAEASLAGDSAVLLRNLATQGIRHEHSYTRDLERLVGEIRHLAHETYQ